MAEEVHQEEEAQALPEAKHGSSTGLPSQVAATTVSGESKHIDICLGVVMDQPIHGQRLRQPQKQVMRGLRPLLWGLRPLTFQCPPLQRRVAMRRGLKEPALLIKMKSLLYQEG